MNKKAIDISTFIMQMEKIVLNLTLELSRKTLELKVQVENELIKLLFVLTN